jgi:hypothetical protein
MQKTDDIVDEALLVNLAYLEKADGNYDAAIRWFLAAKKLSPAPEALQKQIDDIQKKQGLQIPLVPQIIN